MTTHDTQRLLAFADTLADAARGAILPYFRAAYTVEHKEGGAPFDPVTEADRASESAMRALIEQHFPDHGILGEEYGVRAAKSGYVWVLDPIDGTRAFISGLPSWGVLIALTYEGEPIAGIMDQPYIAERFRGWNSGAELIARGTRTPLKTRACASLRDATIMTTDSYLFHGAEAVAFTRVREGAKLTRYGFDCYAYCMVAAGYIDGVVESGLKPFDIDALIPIVRGAGGDVTTWRGDSAATGGQSLAFGDARLAEELKLLLADAAH
ncbi:histidinol-phosphatase [alpha proteobacterium U9-1i]|nr:histidinol-phosphatase [alpha proteobacterium U9-1i]